MEKFPEEWNALGSVVNQARFKGDMGEGETEGGKKEFSTQTYTV